MSERITASNKGNLYAPINKLDISLGEDIVCIREKVYYTEHYVSRLRAEIGRLNNIIKEVRECVEKNMKIISKEQAKGTRLPVGSFMWNADKLLEILDKADKGK